MSETKSKKTTMKKNILIKGAACLLALGTFSSCSEDYLALEPESSVSSALATSTVEYGSYIVNVIGGTLYFLPNGWAPNFACGNQGEASIMTRYGEGYGQDAYYNTMGNPDGENIKLRYLANSRSSNLALPWNFYYGIIGQANEALANIDNAEGEEAQRNFVKAQLLTFRAFSYTRLLQMFGPRWADSNNGERLTVVLRLEPSTGDIPASTMNKVLEQIYADLDLALDLYAQSGNSVRINPSSPDAQIAAGVYARAALLKEDWAKAEEMAHKACEGRQPMSGDEYLNGFCTANAEWMWYGSNATDDEQGYANWGCFNACNGIYPVLWTEYPGAGSINKDLYDKMDPNDIRRELFLMPDKFDNENQKARFYNSKYVNQETMNFYNISNNKPMSLKAVEYYKARTEKVVAPGTVYTAYTGEDGSGEAHTPVAVFGAQTKFFGYDAYTRSQYPWMRVSEMYLTEAEAAAMQGHTQAAQAALNAVISKRIPGYSCTLTGDALIQEIRLQRRIELWGEGFNFFDLKRWNLPIVRRAWKADDPTSGNIPSYAAGTVLPTDGNHWVFAMPSTEYEYNKAVHDEDYLY